MDNSMLIIASALESGSELNIDSELEDINCSNSHCRLKSRKHIHGNICNNAEQKKKALEENLPYLDKEISDEDDEEQIILPSTDSESDDEQFIELHSMYG